MIAIRRIRKYVEAHPSHPASAILADLVDALEANGEFPLSELYELDHLTFDLAIDLLKDWRLDRYYASRLRPLDFVLHGGALEREESRPAS